MCVQKGEYTLFIYKYFANLIRKIYLCTSRMTNCSSMCKIKIAAKVKEMLQNIFNRKHIEKDMPTETDLIHKVLVDTPRPIDDKEFIIDETEDEFDPGLRRLIELSESEASEYLKAIRENEDEKYE